MNNLAIKLSNLHTHTPCIITQVYIVIKINRIPGEKDRNLNMQADYTA